MSEQRDKGCDDLKMHEAILIAARNVLQARLSSQNDTDESDRTRFKGLLDRIASKPNYNR